MDAIGLDGIVVAETRLSLVDGQGGELIVSGHRLSALAESADIARVATLLWGQTVSSAELGTGRAHAFEQLAVVRGSMSHVDGMAALQAALAHLAPDATNSMIAAAVSVFAAAWSRSRRNLPPIAPDPNAPHDVDYLRMLGRDATPDRAAALRRYLVAVVDHGVNASTFAARVVTSTGASSVAATVAAIGALSGPLHGGAPGPVLDMLDACEGDPRAWVTAEVDAGKRIMGMGHRVYRARDPRAAVLERACELLEERGISTRLAAARQLEQSAREVLSARHPDRPLCANVELYTAVLLDALGLDREQFAPTFAAARVFGWLGHIDEQRRAARLIRPASRYVGAMPGAISSSG